MSISRGESFFPLFAGGMASCGSAVSRRTSSLSAGFPGTIAESVAPLRVSNRSLAVRSFGSGPWQAKQLFARIGRTSRLKSTVSAG
jgi:hypothetical protein